MAILKGRQMKTFRERIDGKPSVAIRAMISGLREMSTWDGWQVDMGNFFLVTHHPVSVCHACAATAAIMQLTGVRLR